jgi:5-methylcytosine-specific restriction endonuclease McrA
MMELRYTFDTRRYYLGTPCPHEHFWPGTELSLRKLYVSPQGVRVNNCVGCIGRKLSDWKISFIDHKAMGISDDWRLGKLCKAEHRWNDLPITLRNKHGKCLECEKLRQQSESYKQTREKYLLANHERRNAEARERMRALMSDTDYAEVERKRNRERVARRRAKHGRASRSKYGLPHGFCENNGLPKRQVPQIAKMYALGLTPEGIKQELNQERLLKTAGSSPTVPQLVAAAQRQYWKKNPSERKKHTNKKQKEYHEYRCLVDKNYRDLHLLYHRQKSKRRKAQMRNSVAIQLTGRQVRERFRQFDNRCAYCGCTGDLHIEHVVPISKGGTHAMGNIIPACKNCNFSKAAHEAESWYRAQPFFSELRWRKICRVLGWGRGSVGQLALL